LLDELTTDDERANVTALVERASKESEVVRTRLQKVARRWKSVARSPAAT